MQEMKVIFNRKYLIKLVLPLVVEQILAVTVGMADMIMVSGAGDTAVSGVSLVNTISNLLIYVIQCTGNRRCSGGISGIRGKKERDRKGCCKSVDLNLYYFFSNHSRNMYSV